MSTDRPRTRLPEVAGAIATGVAMVVLALAVLVAMHVLTGRLLPGGGAQGQPADTSAELRVPSHEIGQVLVPGRAAAPGTMGA
ncbi:hypothetical protein SAMN05216184_101398 [Georgenia satyanarayanai]|uniref:Uncharacterized protein n=1 Tax=Georgenia satyanarayanai TaxID=860221 RepID=A0A2Y8ZYR8_9MICO|nr:hypothetical protein [Georgenia satyanarayanai]PYG01933.1 hypothetical protein A8987_101398 [Georgenia satyanarayanai]SSA36736.1 hypothetical protein SAMN05216184_101398 [Georgenia satyanarayanai]